MDETEQRNLADKDIAEIFCTHDLIWINSLEMLAPRLIPIEWNGRIKILLQFIQKS